MLLPFSCTCSEQVHELQPEGEGPDVMMEPLRQHDPGEQRNPSSGSVRFLRKTANSKAWSCHARQCAHVDCGLAHLRLYSCCGHLVFSTPIAWFLPPLQQRLRLPSLLPAEERLRAIADAQMETEIAAARAHAEAVKNHGR